MLTVGAYIQCLIHSLHFPFIPSILLSKNTLQFLSMQSIALTTAPCTPLYLKLKHWFINCWGVLRMVHCHQLLVMCTVLCSLHVCNIKSLEASSLIMLQESRKKKLFHKLSELLNRSLVNIVDRFNLGPGMNEWISEVIWIGDIHLRVNIIF